MFVVFINYKHYNMAELLNRGYAGGPCIRKVDWQDKSECVRLCTTAAFLGQKCRASPKSASGQRGKEGGGKGREKGVKCY